MRILVTGGTGMVGTALKNTETEHELILVGSQDCNLESWTETKSLVSRVSPDAVLHLAARAGGVKSNMQYMGDFYRENISINTNVLEAARVAKVGKVISLLSTCIYPDKVSYPLTEDQIHDGPPHDSNYAYAYAKRMLDVQSRAYRKQYGCNFITVVPNNLYGEGDNFDLQNSHVIPAIMRKMYEAKLRKGDVTLWGDGSPLREFTYSGDLARILLFLLEKYDDPSPINVGDTREISIKCVAETIAEILEFNGKIVWDSDKPTGQHKKPSDNSKLISLGWDRKDYSNFEESLRSTCLWFQKEYPNIRGV